jgi:hypothetical protein
MLAGGAVRHGGVGAVGVEARAVGARLAVLRAIVRDAGPTQPTVQVARRHAQARHGLTRHRPAREAADALAFGERAISVRIARRIERRGIAGIADFLRDFADRLVRIAALYRLTSGEDP